MKVIRTGITVVKNQRVMVGEQGEIVIVEEDSDITGDCRVELVKSKHTNGYYIKLIHGDKCIAVLGVDENSKHCLRDNGYRLVPAEHARVSFRVEKQ